MRRSIFAALTVFLLMAWPADAQTQSPIINTLAAEELLLAPAMMWETCVTVPAGTLRLTAAGPDHPMSERVKIDIYQPVGMYAMPISYATVAPEEMLLASRVDPGEYCVRFNVSLHRERYEQGSQSPARPPAHVTFKLTHEPA